MVGNKMPAAIICVLLGFVIIVAESIPLSSTTHSPCPEIFQYDQVSDGKWKAKLTLISDSELHGVWVRLLTEPKLVDVVPPEGFMVKHNDTPEVRISSREYLLEANTPKSFTVRGKLINGGTPELLQVILNGKIICSSYKQTSSVLYGGDFNSNKYLSSIAQNNLNQNIPNVVKCGNIPFPLTTTPSDELEIRPNQFPWQASLFNRNSTSSLLCEATLVSEDLLLTSAHCVAWQKTSRPISASLIVVKLKNLNVNDGGDNLEVRNIIIHPQYNEDTLENDIAILRLEKALTIDEITQPICLPAVHKSPDDAFILGYGFREGGNFESLKIARSSPVKDDKCIELEPLYKDLLNDNNYCAVYESKKFCVGSSGSAVMDDEVEPKKIWTLRGVLSVGRALHKKVECDLFTPVLIVDITKYLKWIRSNFD